MAEKNIFLSERELKYYNEKQYNVDFPRLEKTLMEPRFTITQLGIKARDATYWDKNGILPELKGKGARRKYDLIQGIWLRLIPQMRSLGISIENINRFKKNIFDFEVSVEDLIKSKDFVKKLQTIAKDEMSNEKLNELINSSQFKAMIENEKLNIFQLCIMYVILFKKRVSLIVNEEGFFTPYSTERHNELIAENPLFIKALDAPHFSVSLNAAYADLIKGWKEEPFFEEITIVSNTEIEILNALKEPNVKSVTIKFTNGEPDLIETVQEEEVDLATRFCDIIAKNGYHTVTVKTRNGNIVKYENRILKKIKSIR
jgi:DNA-binding transcriptional MerR regulator